AELTIVGGDRVLRLRIDAVERDPVAKRGEVWLHRMSFLAADGLWRNPCEAGPDGRSQGFPLAGRMRDDLVLEAAGPGAVDLTCTAGAQGKCVRFGYLPWQDAAMRDLYNACVHMVRADYCGDGVGTTRNGMLIDLYDDAGIQLSDNDPALEFEAGWSPAGAVCVRHTRVPEHMTLEALPPACPHLAGRLGPECSEAAARA